MVFRDLLTDTLRTLWAHKLRTFLTMFGIACGIFSITIMGAATDGLGSGLKRQHETFGKDVMIVFSGRTSLQAGGQRAGRQIWWLEDDYIPVRDQSPACRYVMPELGNNASVRSVYNSGTILVEGSLPPFTEIRSIQVAEGRFYNEQDDDIAARVAFLGSDAKKQLFGGRPALGETIWMNNIPYAVIGVMKEKDQNSSYDGMDIRKIFIPFRAVARDFPNKPPSHPPHTVDRLLVAPKSLALHEDCVRQVRAALGLLHNFDPHDKEAAGIWDTVKNAQANQLVIDGMKYFLGAVGVVTLFLGGLGVMNVMLVAVRERTREIGVRKAIGATRRAIVSQFFVETMLIVFLSGGIGLGVAYSLSLLVGLFPKAPFFDGLLMTWQTGLVSFLLLGTVAVLSAVYPARRAAAVDPIEALRFEAGG
jgi:putative ABC transport system permease protein